MKTRDPENERLKRRYCQYLKEAKRYSENSIDGVLQALHRFEIHSNFRCFKRFHIQQAIAFKARLGEERNMNTGKPLSKPTICSTLAALRKFFCWLADQPGYRSRLSYADAEYFNLSFKETRIARATRDRASPSLDQVLHVLRSMPATSAIQKRDRALIAFAMLTGCRDGALASLKIKHVDLAGRRVVQDAREVHTKFSKTMTTFFFPIHAEFLAVVMDWIGYLRDTLWWGPDDPLFPATKIERGTNRLFRAAGLTRMHWRNANSIRKIFKASFEACGLPYFNPHTFRNTLAQLGERICETPEQFKAWSQNLGHEGVMTTFSSYGKVAPPRQADIMLELQSGRGDPISLTEILRDALAAVQRAEAQTLHRTELAWSKP